MALASNDFGTVCLYKTSLNKRVIDYAISFNGDEHDFDLLIHKTYDLFMAIMKQHEGKRIFGRLVAKVNFIHVDLNEDDNVRSYHFPSYATHEIEMPHDFFNRNMMKIASRLNDFNKEGSNLLLKNIEHIHILIS